MAIEFCKEHDDSDLWSLLIDESVQNPEILLKLFDGIIGNWREIEREREITISQIPFPNNGSFCLGYIDPEGLLHKIKADQNIPGLQQSLFQMLWDYRLQVNNRFEGQANLHHLIIGSFTG